MGFCRAPPVRVAHESATIAECVHGLTKADTRGATSVEMRVHIRRARFNWIPPMVNRIKHLLGECEETTKTKLTDYQLVETLNDVYVVELATALDIERQLEKAVESSWLEFRDVFGARHRVLARFIYQITESTQEIRAAWRAFRKAREDEAKEDEDPYENSC
jgi:hypothetical protein